MKNSPLNVAVVGGDLRQLSLSELLARDGHGVRVYAMEKQIGQLKQEGIRICVDLRQALEGTQCVVLPLPLCDEQGKLNAPFSSEILYIDEIFDCIKQGVTVAAGKIPSGVYEKAVKNGLLLADYLEREEFAIANGVATVEGALQIAMEELPITIHNARCLVIGYGRIGRLLSHQLKNLGAHVTVSARKYADIAWIQAYGYEHAYTGKLKGKLSGFDIVFNTVPARVLGKDELIELKPGCLCIDLASKPGGLDFQAAREMGVKVIWALSLPGKVAPVTSGEIVKNTLYNILAENGLWT